jgi:dihydroanticapsin dehydrogenase
MAGALDGRAVILTGCVANIGRATALLFAREGARLHLLDLDPAGAATAAEVTRGGGEATFEVADVSSAADWARAVAAAQERLGSIDVVVNNAGLQRAGRVTEFSVADWDALMGVNPRSCFLAAKHVVPAMEAAGGGVLVNVASLAGLHGGPGLTGYSASKGAIVAFTKALAAEVAPLGIRVNALCPGWVDTAFNQPAIDFLGGRDNLDAAVAAAVPMGRQAVPEEIASALVFLASDASSYMTGQALAVDGGVY